MRPMIMAVASLALVIGAAGCSSEPSAEVAGAPSSLETAALDVVTRPAPEPEPEPPVLPKPDFTRTMHAAVGLAESEAALDVCAGPIAIDVGEGNPVLIAEHDYCGGSAWMPKLGKGDAVKLKGDGVDAGTYVVKEIRFQIRGQGKVSDLPQTDAVLQTCVSETQMVLVGVDKLDPMTLSS